MSLAADTLSSQLELSSDSESSQPASVPETKEGAKFRQFVEFIPKEHRANAATLWKNINWSLFAMKMFNMQGKRDVDFHVKVDSDKAEETLRSLPCKFCTRNGLSQEDLCDIVLDALLLLNSRITEDKDANRVILKNGAEEPLTPAEILHAALQLAISLWSVYFVRDCENNRKLIALWREFVQHINFVSMQQMYPTYGGCYDSGQMKKNRQEGYFRHDTSLCHANAMFNLFKDDTCKATALCAPIDGIFDAEDRFAPRKDRKRTQPDEE